MAPPVDPNKPLIFLPVWMQHRTEVCGCDNRVHIKTEGHTMKSTHPVTMINKINI